MEFGFECTLPNLDEVPADIASIFRDMINCYLRAKERNPRLPFFLDKSTIFSIQDDDGNICCLFKTYTNPKFAETEAAIYLLDHPEHGHRSITSASSGLSRVPPAVYFRTKDVSGCLVKYVKSDGVVEGITDLRTVPLEIQKLCITHIRFGNPDSHSSNTLVITENGIHQFTVVDNEECFSNGYTLSKLWWRTNKVAETSFLPQMINYVKELDADRDINFLKKCGWNLSSTFIKTMKIFTHFLKQSVELELTPKDIALLTSRTFKPSNLTLHELVTTCDRKLEVESYVKKDNEKVAEGLKEYAKKFHPPKQKRKK